MLAAAACFLVGGCGAVSNGPSWSDLRWSDDDAQWMPGGRTIVFVSNRTAMPSPDDAQNGRYGLYLIRADGAGLRLLSAPGRCDDHNPIPSPNGSEIAFIRYCPPDGESLMLIPSTGGHARQLVSAVSSDAAWSPNGSKLAFTRDRNPSNPFSEDDLYVVAADSRLVRLVAKGHGSSRGDSIGDFAWSHDGRLLAFGCEGGSVCAANMRTAIVRRLHRLAPGDDVSSVAWSSGDDELAFIDGSGGSLDPDYNAWVMASDGTQLRQLSRFGKGNVDGIEWLPRQASTLVVNTDEAYVYTVRSDGSHKHDLGFAADIVDPTPDGNSMLIVRRQFDSEGIDWRSALQVANLETGRTTLLTQRGN